MVPAMKATVPAKEILNKNPDNAYMGGVDSSDHFGAEMTTDKSGRKKYFSMCSVSPCRMRASHQTLY